MTANTNFHQALSAMKCRVGEVVAQDLLLSTQTNAFFKGIEKYRIAMGTHPGFVRRRNEDRAVFARVVTAEQREFAVALVCDGVGGSELGDVAASLCIASFLDGLALAPSRLSMPSVLERLVRDSDEFVRTHLKGRGTSTLSVLLLDKSNRAAASNVGDSRIFEWSPGKSLRQISIDDTFENEIRGLPAKDYSALDAHGLRGRLTQAIGESGRSSDDLRVSILEDIGLESGLILATDGAWKSDEPGFELVAVNAGNAAEAVRRLLAFSSWTGGVDNVSIIALDRLSILFAAGEESSAAKPGCISATVWLGDTKILVRDTVQSATAKSKPDASYREGEQDYISKHKSKRKQGKKDARESAAEQLELAPTSTDKSSEPKSRPRLLISTDADETGDNK